MNTPAELPTGQGRVPPVGTGARESRYLPTAVGRRQAPRPVVPPEPARPFAVQAAAHVGIPQPAHPQPAASRRVGASGRGPGLSHLPDHAHPLAVAQRHRVHQRGVQGGPARPGPRPGRRQPVAGRHEPGPRGRPGRAVHPPPGGRHAARHAACGGCLPTRWPTPHAALTTPTTAAEAAVIGRPVPHPHAHTDVTPPGNPCPHTPCDHYATASTPNGTTSPPPPRPGRRWPAGSTSSPPWPATTTSNDSAAPFTSATTCKPVTSRWPRWCGWPPHTTTSWPRGSCSSACCRGPPGWRKPCRFCSVGPTPPRRPCSPS